MTNETFKRSSESEKITEIIRRSRKALSSGKNLDQCIYTFDIEGRMRVVEIKERSLFKAGRERILATIMKDKIKDLSEVSPVIKVMYIRPGFFNARHPDTTNMHIERDFTRSDNECIYVTIEDAFDFNAEVYDVITGEDQGKSYFVVSEKPIETIKTSKLDPDEDLKSYFKNLVKYE